MADLVEAAALAVAGFAVLAGLVTLLLTQRVRAALPVALDFLTAAGLLRLSAQQTWQAIAGAAAVIAVRHLVLWAFAQQTGPLPVARSRFRRV